MEHGGGGGGGGVFYDTFYCTFCKILAFHIFGVFFLVCFFFKLNYKM